MTDDAIRSQIQRRFSQIALSPGSEQVFSVGLENACNLGYDRQRLTAWPGEVTESFCGVGNPWSLGLPLAGQTILDLGCGAGLDSVVAAAEVGAAGKVVALDMTTAMLDKARRNAEAVGASNIGFLLANADNLPLSDATVDLVVSNGVLNLCANKPQVLAELYRVLRVGGRLQMADILLHADVSPQEVARIGSWSD